MKLNQSIYIVQCTTEAVKYWIYRIPKLLYSNRTEPNNTEPNLMIVENKVLTCLFNYSHHILVYVAIFQLKNWKFRKKSCLFKKFMKFGLKCQLFVQKIWFGITVSPWLTTFLCQKKIRVNQNLPWLTI